MKQNDNKKDANESKVKFERKNGTTNQKTKDYLGIKTKKKKKK